MRCLKPSLQALQGARTAGAEVRSYQTLGSGRYVALLLSVVMIAACAGTSPYQKRGAEMKIRMAEALQETDVISLKSFICGLVAVEANVEMLEDEYCRTTIGVYYPAEQAWGDRFMKERLCKSYSSIRELREGDVRGLPDQGENWAFEDECPYEGWPNQVW